MLISRAIGRGLSDLRPRLGDSGPRLVSAYDYPLPLQVPLSSHLVAFCFRAVRWEAALIMHVPGPPKYPRICSFRHKGSCLDTLEVKVGPHVRLLLEIMFVFC